MENKTTGWDLTYFFETEADFEEALSKFKGYPAKLQAYQGQLATKLGEYLDLSEEANKLFAKIYFYASMDSDLDKKDVKRSERLSKVEYAVNLLSEATAFDAPEMLSLGQQKIERFLNDNPKYEPYRFFFKKLFLKKDHVLSSDKESLLSAFNPLMGEQGTLYSALTVADRKPAEATLSDGKQVTVTMANWSSLIKEAKTAEDRQLICPTREEVAAVYRELKNRRWHADDLQPLCARMGTDATGKTLVAVEALRQVGLVADAERDGVAWLELVRVAGKKNLADAPILKCLEEK